MTKWAAQFKTVTHYIAALIVTAVTIYTTNDAVHQAVNNALANNKKLAAILAGISSIWLAYTNSQKVPQDAASLAAAARKASPAIGVFFALLALGASAHGQTSSILAPDGYPVLNIAADQPAPSPTPSLPTNLYAAGLAYNPGASPAIAGNAMYAHLMSADMGTYGFTLVDIFPISNKPGTVSTNVGAGVAQKVFSIGKLPVFVPSSVAISATGTNTGWDWSTGLASFIKLGGKWWLMPNGRTQKSSVSNGTGYQVIFGMSLGWGK